MTVKPSKPFNPILGETYQGFMCLDFDKATKLSKDYPNKKEDAEVFEIFAEQTSHHPAVSNFLIESDMV